MQIDVDFIHNQRNTNICMAFGALASACLSIHALCKQALATQNLTVKDKLEFNSKSNCVL